MYSYLEQNEAPHRTQPNKKIQKRGVRKRQPGNWDPKILQFTRVMKDLLCVETAMWHANGSMSNSLLEQSTRRYLDKFKRPSHSWRKRRMQSILFGYHWRARTEQNDHRRNNSVTWKAIRGFWDGNFKDNGKPLFFATIFFGQDWRMG